MQIHLTAAPVQFDRPQNKLIDDETNKSPAVFHTALPGGAARQKARRKRHKPHKGLVIIPFLSPTRLFAGRVIDRGDGRLTTSTD